MEFVILLRQYIYIESSPVVNTPFKEGRLSERDNQSIDQSTNQSMNQYHTDS